MTYSLLVNEIFNSIDGEGIRTGLPVTFIRLAGCNLNCKYCDTTYAQQINDGIEWTIQQVINKIEYKAITLTGGEPLTQRQGVIALLHALNNRGDYQVNIETNGSIDISPFVIPVRAGGGFFTLDYKCLCSGETGKMLESNYALLDSNDVLKFVVGCEQDIELVDTFITNHSNLKCHLFISPCFGQIDNEYLVSQVMELQKRHNKDIRFQLQLHKIIWDPERRGV